MMGTMSLPLALRLFASCDETLLALVVAAVGFELEGLAEQAQHVVPGVQGAVDDRRDPLLGVVADDGVLEDGLAGAGFAEDEAESALLGVDLEDVEVALLVFEERVVGLDDEGVVAEAEVGADHMRWWFHGFVRSRLSRAAVVGDGVEDFGHAEALSLVIDDGLWHGGAVAVKAQGDGECRAGRAALRSGRC